ncbi:putative ABC transporter ATP-binding protein [Collinsella sp. AK_207A]|uniref:ABC transporter ATP-binding protein n=1 Tax=Collinsella sp. AK_207A TaxID=2650472 RepID=UPI0012607D9B|nr:ABC transporter ATP-binding protein [Collinsella sp. AK_207A]VWL93356.1 putative ABC transporter ATP-binding protein [Collinsella sp. AK_207A]
MSSENERVQVGDARGDERRAAQVAAQTAAQAAATEEVEVPADALGTAWRLWEAAAGMRWRLVVAALSAVGFVVFSLAAPAYSAYLLDLLWGRIQAMFERGEGFVVTMETGGREIVIYLVIWTIAWVFYTVQAMVMSSFAERLNLSLRNRIAAKLERLPLRYYDARQPGDTISRATNDLDKVSEVLQRGVLQLIIAVLMLTGAVIMMARYNLLLTSVYVFFMLLSFAATKVIAARTLSIASARQAAVGKLTSSVEEAYSGRAVIKAFGREQASAAEMRAAAEELARTSTIADSLTNAAGPAIRFLGRIALVIIGMMAGGMLVAGRLTVGVFQAFFQYVNTASEPLTQMSMTINMLQGALAAAERVFRLLDEEEVEPDPAQPAELPRNVEGRVAFEHVRFGYEAKKPLMRDVSLVAEPGQKVAIVGATGAGKTTLINLLMRFYEIDGGRITLDGVDTRRLTRADLRRQFGMVLQDAWLFEGTIAENIAYGCPGASRDEVVAAAKAAHVDFFVHTLPQGYDTMLSGDAESISQGQRQLLTIARAMLCDPAILILDEATSSVDTRTEQAIVRAMEALMYGRTSFVIAHRLSTIVDADLILVMDHGNIVEQGTHEELLAADGAYAELYNSQFS